MRYSLIIPHYNDIERLERLLKTVPVERKDLEILVVDDCSPDQSALARTKEYWPMVRWLTTAKNSGAGASRNIGLMQAQGEYLVFADSDDEFLPGAFNIFEGHVARGDELVYFLAEAVQEADGSPSNRAEKANGLCLAYLRQPSRATLERLQLGHVVPWAKVYSREYIINRGTLFEEVRASNDVFFNVTAAAQASNIRVVPAQVYRISRRAGSITVDESLQAILERVRVLARVNRKLAVLNISGRMHAGGYLYRSLAKGLPVFTAVFCEALRGGLIWPIFRRVSLLEVYRFLRRYSRERSERARISNGKG